jgi:hypothetical protein
MLLGADEVDYLAEDLSELLKLVAFLVDETLRKQDSPWLLLRED